MHLLVCDNKRIFKNKKNKKIIKDNKTKFKYYSSVVSFILTFFQQQILSVGNLSYYI
jgi:hypothetical protein